MNDNYYYVLRNIENGEFYYDCESCDYKFTKDLKKAFKMAPYSRAERCCKSLSRYGYNCEILITTFKIEE